MDIRPAICYMMEALSYLGMKANNVDFDERLSKALKSAGGSERARHFLSASRTMYDLLDSAVHVDERELKACFGFFSGMPDGHPYGYNIAAMLCSEAANADLDYDAQKALIRSYDRTQTAKAALCSFGIFSDSMKDSFDFFDSIDKLPLSRDDKLKVFSICTHPETYLERVFALLDTAVAAIRGLEDQVFDIINEYCAQYDLKNVTDTLNEQMGFLLPDDVPIKVIPYLLNPGITMVLDKEGREYVVHIGMLYLMRFLGEAPNNDAETLETLKSISDSSRLEILRCLSNGEMYGREIAKQLGLYSTTISHHMAKLINCRIVRCRLAGNKAYYSLDNEGAKRFLDSLHDILTEKTTKQDGGQ